MEWEFDILYWLQDFHNPLLDKLAFLFTMLAEKGIGWILLVLLILFLVKDKRVGLTGCGALCISFLLCNILLKNMIQRDRPCWIDPSISLLVGIPDDYSFPSGHSSCSFAAATAIFQYYKGWGLLALLAAMLIALSRLYHFVHFPTDVLVGAVVGVISGLLSGLIVRDFYRAYPDFKVPFIEKKED